MVYYKGNPGLLKRKWTTSRSRWTAEKKNRSGLWRHKEKNQWIHGMIHQIIHLFIGLEPLFWSNYSDLTRPIFPKRWFSKGNPLISGKSRLVNYYNLARLFSPSILGVKSNPLFLVQHPCFRKSCLSPHIPPKSKCGALSLKRTEKTGTKIVMSTPPCLEDHPRTWIRG